MFTHNHIALLVALLRRPGHRVKSYKEWIEAALPVLRRFRTYPAPGNLRRGIRTLRRSLVARETVGSAYACTLTEEGRRIATGETPVRIRGMGLFKGMAAWRQKPGWR